MQQHQQSMIPPRFPGLVPQMLQNQFVLRSVPPRSAVRGMLQFRMQQQQQQQPETMQQLPTSSSLQQMQAQLQHMQPGLRMFPPVPASMNNNQMMLQPQFQQQQQRHVVPPVSSSTNRGLFHISFSVCTCDLSLISKVFGVFSAYFYRLHPKDDGRLYFHFVCQSTPWQGGTYLPCTRGGGYPPSQVGWGTHLYRGGGGYLPWQRVPTFPGSRHIPWQGGYLPWQGGVPTLAGGTYLGRGVPTLAGGYLPSQHVLAKQRAVSLLRSRRRTFLFHYAYTLLHILI